MIYDHPDSDQPIRQGDIFVGLPRIDISLQKLVVCDESGERTTKWEEFVNSSSPVCLLASARPVSAIVATQDCDASRSPDITLCEIRPFKEVERKSRDTTSPKSYKNLITQHSRINQKWFYLPADPAMGFENKMAVDFLVTLRLPRKDLESLMSTRKGRLNDIAEEHFRERISEFFRRYPYDEWYALNKEELQTYITEYPGTKPFPWQEDFMKTDEDDH